MLNTWTILGALAASPSGKALIAGRLGCVASGQDVWKDPGHGYLRGPARPRAACLRLMDLCGLIAVCLVFGSLSTFALVGAGFLGSAWLAIALGEALLALALVSQRIGGSAPPPNTMKPPDRNFPKSFALAEGRQATPTQRAPNAPRSRSPVTLEQRPKQRAWHTANSPPPCNNRWLRPLALPLIRVDHQKVEVGATVDRCVRALHMRIGSSTSRAKRNFWGSAVRKSIHPGDANAGRERLLRASSDRAGWV